MVIYIVDDFDFVVDNLVRCRYGTYQVVEIEKDQVVLKVRAGSFGYEKIFSSVEDDDFVRKLDVLKSRGFAEVERAVDEDTFFR